MLKRPWLILVLAGMGWLCLTYGAGAQTFSNPNPIIINDVQPANPYPSVIAVSGITDSVVKVTVSTVGFSHTFPNDIGFMMTGPTGVSVVFDTAAGDGTDAVNLNWTFDDAAAVPLPNNGGLSSGTFQANGDYGGYNFAAPAPARPYGTSLALFNGLNPNGNWNLFVQDFVGGDTGQFSGGWSITFTTQGAAVPEPTTMALGAVLGVPMVYMVRRMRRNRVRISKG